MSTANTAPSEAASAIHHSSVMAPSISASTTGPPSHDQVAANTPSLPPASSMETAVPHLHSLTMYPPQVTAATATSQQQAPPSPPRPSEAQRHYPVPTFRLPNMRGPSRKGRRVQLETSNPKWYFEVWLPQACDRLDTLRKKRHYEGGEEEDEECEELMQAVWRNTRLAVRHLACLLRGGEGERGRERALGDYGARVGAAADFLEEWLVLAGDDDDDWQ